MYALITLHACTLNKYLPTCTPTHTAFLTLTMCRKWAAPATHSVVMASAAGARARVHEPATLYSSALLAC
eukprot:scaffold24802_cov21-Tisochrysis_lutea.AAC.2